MTDQPQVTPVFVDLTGPQSIRARFWPKQILNIPDVAFVVGLTREGLYKQIRLGQCSLLIHKSGSGLMKVRLDDLIVSSVGSTPATSGRIKTSQGLGFDQSALIRWTGMLFRLLGKVKIDNEMGPFLSHFSIVPSCLGEGESLPLVYSLP